MIGERIKQIRRDKKITQEELSEKAGVNRSYLSVIENGHSSPTIDVVERIAAAMGVSLWVLISAMEDQSLVYESEEESEMSEGLREFLEDHDEMLLAQPSAAEIEELRRIVFKSRNPMDKRFYRDALLAIRRSARSSSSKK